jgi:Ferritin-like domain
MNDHHTEIDRQLRAVEREQQDAMPRFRDSLLRLFAEPNDTPTDAKAQAFLGGFNRRRFLVVGGGGLAATALLAACGDDDSSSAESGSSGTTATTSGGATSTTGGMGEMDVTIARTAASLENFAISVYDTAIANADALGIEAQIGAAAQLFRDQHQQHADAFNAAATNLGGEAYTDPNPTAADAFADTIAGLSDQAGVLMFAHDLEEIASQTYQSAVGVLSTPELRQTTMSVGGVEARHQSILAMFIEGGDPNPYAFQPLDQAADQSFYV